MGLPKHAHSPVHVCGLLNFHVKNFSKPLWTLYFCLFLQAFSSIYCLPCYHPLQQPTKIFPCKYFNKPHLCSSCSTGGILRYEQVKLLFVFPQSHQTVQVMTILCEWSPLCSLRYLECGLLFSRLLAKLQSKEIKVMVSTQLFLETIKLGVSDKW